MVGLLSGCYVDTGYGQFPESAFVKKETLIREWATQDAELTLSDNGSFMASKLTLQYYQCRTDGLREKSGKGTWTTSKGRESTSVFIDFENGCYATLWAGTFEGQPVLWAPQADDDALILK